MLTKRLQPIHPVYQIVKIIQESPGVKPENGNHQKGGSLEHLHFHCSQGDDTGVQGKQLDQKLNKLRIQMLDKRNNHGSSLNSVISLMSRMMREHQTCVM